RSLGDVLLELRMMMSIDPHEHVHGHAEIPGDPRNIDARVHEPRCRCMSHDVRRTLALAPGKLVKRAPAAIHERDWLAGVMDHVADLPRRVPLFSPSQQ